MATNELGQEDRIRLGKQKEAEILNLLCSLEIEAHGLKIVNWVGATLEEDKREKIDAFCLLDDGLTCSAQIKYRETGKDLGIAAIRPYRSDEDFINRWTNFGIAGRNFDRDLKKSVDFYVSYAGGTLCVVSGKKVRKACLLMLDKLVANGGFGNSKSFTFRGYGGAELRLVRDAGKNGYSAGQNKVICYLDPEMLERVGAFRKVI